MVVAETTRKQHRHRLPDFLIIGAMKAGTTSLYHYLRPHPEVFMPKIKELDFFAEQGNWKRGFGWYARQFQDAGLEARAVGEASTVYTKYPHYPGVAERIAANLPDVRLIYVVRNPIERIRSHYQHRVAVGAEKDPLGKAVLNNPIYLDYSRYALQLEQYRPHIPPDRLLVITSESLRDDRLATIRGIYSFLGVTADFVPPTLTREFYRTEGRPMYPPALWALRRAARRWIPGAKRAKEFVDSMGARRRRASGHSAERDHERFRVPEDVAHVLEERLADDVRRLRAYLPPDFDGWGLA
jgi:hypothetical protein